MKKNFIVILLCLGLISTTQALLNNEDFVRGRFADLRYPHIVAEYRRNFRSINSFHDPDTEIPHEERAYIRDNLDHIQYMNLMNPDQLLLLDLDQRNIMSLLISYNQGRLDADAIRRRNLGELVFID